MSRESTIKPLSIRAALLYFGVPAALVAFIVHVVMPRLAERGLPIFFNFLFYATAPMLALIVASLIAYRREGNAMSWPDFKNRFRLNKMDGTSWLWAIGLTLFMFLSVGLLSFTARWLASFAFFAPPDYWPAELTNLSECHEPFFQLVKDLSVSGAKIAKDFYDAPGWTAHHNTDGWRGTSPINASTPTSMSPVTPGVLAPRSM